MPTKKLTSFFIRHQGKNVRINVAEIYYVEARKNYSRIVTASGVYFAICTLKRMEKLLPRTDFQRIHRAYIVALAWIKAFDTTQVHGETETVPIGEMYRQSLLVAVTLVGDLRKTPVAELN
jgi:DNA-binding LytR/AlgR family response regulator